MRHLDVTKYAIARPIFGLLVALLSSLIPSLASAQSLNTGDALWVVAHSNLIARDESGISEAIYRAAIIAIPKTGTRTMLEDMRVISERGRQVTSRDGLARFLKDPLVVKYRVYETLEMSMASESTLDRELKRAVATRMLGNSSQAAIGVVIASASKDPTIRSALTQLGTAIGGLPSNITPASLEAYALARDDSQLKGFADAILSGEPLNRMLGSIQQRGVQDSGRLARFAATALRGNPAALREAWESSEKGYVNRVRGVLAGAHALAALTENEVFQREIANAARTLDAGVKVYQAATILAARPAGAGSFVAVLQLADGMKLLGSGGISNEASSEPREAMKMVIEYMKEQFFIVNQKLDAILNQMAVMSVSLVDLQAGVSILNSKIDTLQTSVDDLNLYIKQNNYVEADRRVEKAYFRCMTAYRTTAPGQVDLFETCYSDLLWIINQAGAAPFVFESEAEALKNVPADYRGLDARFIARSFPSVAKRVYGGGPRAEVYLANPWLVASGASGFALAALEKARHPGAVKAEVITDINATIEQIERLEKTYAVMQKDAVGVDRRAYLLKEYEKRSAVAVEAWRNLKAAELTLRLRGDSGGYSPDSFIVPFLRDCVIDGGTPKPQRVASASSLAIPPDILDRLRPVYGKMARGSGSVSRDPVELVTPLELCVLENGSEYAVINDCPSTSNAANCHYIHARFNLRVYAFWGGVQLSSRPIQTVGYLDYKGFGAMPWPGSVTQWGAGRRDVIGVVLDGFVGELLRQNPELSKAQQTLATQTRGDRLVSLLELYVGSYRGTDRLELQLKQRLTNFRTALAEMDKASATVRAYFALVYPDLILKQDDLRSILAGVDHVRIPDSLSLGAQATCILGRGQNPARCGESWGLGDYDSIEKRLVDGPQRLSSQLQQLDLSIQPSPSSRELVTAKSRLREALSELQ